MLTQETAIYYRKKQFRYDEMGHRLQVDRPPEVRNRIATGVKGFFKRL